MNEIDGRKTCIAGTGRRIMSFSVLAFFLFVSSVFMISCAGGNAASVSAEEDVSGNVVGKTLFSGSSREGIPVSGKILQKVTMPPVPAQISFAGETVPLEYADVYESLQRELLVMTYQHGSMMRTILLHNRYGAMVKSLLAKYGLHEDFYYICIAESALQPVVSPAGAAGYWQFLKGTARQYGLIVNNEVDERYNWEKSAEAAAVYFKKAYDEFGTWTLAAASYNIGIKNVRERIEYQGLKNYYDMQFPVETGRYIFRALAYKTMLENPEKYGFYLEEKDLYRPEQWKEVTVTGPVENWSDFASEHGTNFKMLKRYNEWIRLNGLKNRSRDTFVVRVPVSR